MRVLIIGGTALIGPHLIQELGNSLSISDNTVEHIDVHTATRSGTAYYCETAHTVDRKNTGSLISLLNSIQPDVVVDMIPFIRRDAESLCAAIASYNTETVLIAYEQNLGSSKSTPLPKGLEIQYHFTHTPNAIASIKNITDNLQCVLFSGWIEN